MSLDNLRFLLHEMLDVKKLCQLERFMDYDKASFDLMIDSMKTFSDKVLYPVFKEADEDPARFEDGIIHVHPVCLLYTSPSPRDRQKSRMPSSA